jgi:hypothetical protein
MISSIELGAVLAPVVSAVVVTLLYHYLGKQYLGADENAIWNRARRVVLGGFDQYVRKNSTFALTNKAKKDEIVSTLDKSSSEFAQLLESKGYLQCILSGLKQTEINGKVRTEAGSMCYRESRSSLIPDALAFHQVHVFWFECGGGTIKVYAHHEYSSLNPVVAWKHYRAVGQNAEKGVSRVQELL